MKWLLMIISAAFATAGGAVYWNNSKKMETSYISARVEPADIEVTILSTGTVQPENRVDIKVPVNGRAEQVLVQAGDKVKKGQIVLWVSSTERSALLDAARAQGTDEAKQWEEYYKPTPVLAPIDGTIIQRNIQPGQTFTNSDAVLVMADQLTVQAQIDETDLRLIHVKQRAQFVLDAYPTEAIAARVDKMAYDAHDNNHVMTYIVDVLPNQVPPFMRSGMTANVRFLVESRPHVLAVPTESIKKNQDGSAFVLLKNTKTNGTPEAHAIQLGATDGKRTEVLSGLSAGDEVIMPEMKIATQRDLSANPFAPFSRRHQAKR